MISAVPVWYVTKYALTQGIWVVPRDKVEINPVSGSMRILPYRTLVPLSDYFGLLEDAEARVKDLVAAKIKSLDKKRAKLSSYKPKVVIR